MDLTIGIVTYNEEKNIIRVLDSLAQSMPDHILAEFILIDNNSSDRTLIEVDRWFKNKPYVCKVLRLETNHLALARNKVLELSTSPWIYFTDADCEVPKFLLGQIFEEAKSLALKDPLFAGLGGANAPPCEEKLHALIHLMRGHFFGNMNSVQMRSGHFTERVQNLSTCNALFCRSVLKKVHGFHKDFEQVGEDLELSFKLIKNGFHLYFNGQYEVVHWYSPLFWDWFKKMIKYGEAQAHILFHHPKILRTARLLPLMLGILVLPMLFFEKFFFAGVLLLYFMIVVFVSAGLVFREQGFKICRSLQLSHLWSVLNLAFLFIITHLGYFLGEMKGLAWGFPSRILNNHK